MSPLLILFIGAVYIYVAVENAYYGNWPMAVVFAGYAASNVGLYRLAMT